MDKIKRLQWQCRRGMLEVDLVVKRYLAEGYVQASEVEQACFEELLTEGDQVLFNWFTGKAAPDKRYAELVLKMRKL